MKVISPVITVITITYNSIKTLRDTLNSVKEQTYPFIEHIIIDGGSTDGSVELCWEYAHISYILSEKDNGIYDALNKGIKKSSGDLICILHSDDVFYSKDVLENVSDVFKSNNELSAIYGDIIQVKQIGKFILKRFYNSKNWNPKLFAWGRMPAHPSFICKRDIYDNFGYYKTNYKIAADYEFLIRVFHNSNLYIEYKPMITTLMKAGGVSTKNLKNLTILNIEIKRACLENGIYTNMFMIYSKYLYKFLQLIPRTNTISLVLFCSSYFFNLF